MTRNPWASSITDLDSAIIEANAELAEAAGTEATRVVFIDGFMTGDTQITISYQRKKGAKMPKVKLEKCTLDQFVQRHGFALFTLVIWPKIVYVKEVKA